MTATEEQRRAWRCNWLRCIQEFADSETQRRLWLHPDPTNPHYTFNEGLAVYFDGLPFMDQGYAAVQAEGLVTIEEAAAVEQFHALLDAYKAPNDDDFNHYAILNDPNWQRVVIAAKVAQAKLLLLIHDPEERCRLTEVGEYAIEAGARD